MPLKYPTTSKTLLDKIASGDEISWNDFYEKYSPIVKALAKFKGLDAAAADDVCQQVMLQFFKQSKTFKFDPDIARFRTYFGRIVRGRIIDHLRKKYETPVAEFEAVPVDPEADELFMNEWRKLILQEAQAELKSRVAPETYQAYELYAVQGRPVEKVAAYLGKSASCIVCNDNHSIIGQINFSFTKEDS